MKKICMITLIMLLLGMSFPVAAKKHNGAAISNREELERIAENPGGDYYLAADIDLGGTPWTPIPFSGTLDGEDHTIGNLTVITVGEETRPTYDSNRFSYDTSFAGLFSVVTGASIKNLQILNAKIDIETDQNCFTGAIAGYASGTTFKKCTVLTRSKLTISSANAGTGGIVGFSEDCKMDTCKVEAELVFNDVNQSVMCEESLGGIYAAGYGDIKKCTVFTRGYANVFGSAHNGGVVGMFRLPYGFVTRKRMLAIRDSRVDAEIRFFEVAPEKHAFCNAFIGENCAGDCYLTHNTEKHFDFTYDGTAIPKQPEACESPEYTTTVKMPLCKEWGYTNYTCTQCGYSYRDDYTLPRHNYLIKTRDATCVKEGEAIYTCIFCGRTFTKKIPLAPHTKGEWTVKKKPGKTKEGEEECCCTVCGAVLYTRPIPATGNKSGKVTTPAPVIIPITKIEIEESVIELHTGDSMMLSITILPYNASEDSLRFESSDPSVVRVDYEGRLKALYPGTSVIRVYTADGEAEATCSVLVTADPQQQQESHSLFSWLRCG